MAIVFPDKIWLDTLKVGDTVAIRFTERVGEEIKTQNKKIKSISKTGIIKLESNGYTFKDGYRRGFQYSGNCWLQPVEEESSL